MTKQQQKYSQEIKLETIELARTSGKKDSQVERELGLNRGSLYNWRKEVEWSGSQAFPGKGRLKPIHIK